MDRVVQITPRRDKLAPPEAATVQHMLFLDCSSFGQCGIPYRIWPGTGR